MAVDNIFRFYGLQFLGTQFAGPVLLGGVINSSVAANAQVIQDFTDGNPHPTSTSIQAFQEELSFSTFNIDTALDLIGAISQCIEDGSAIELYYAKFSQCSNGPLPGSVHKKIIISQSGDIAGLVHAGSLNCDHRGDAQYSFMIKPKSDGVNSPISIVNDVSLPTGTFDNGNRYTIGPVNVAGNTINGLKSIGIDFGIEVLRESADSSIFDEFVGLSKTASRFSFSGINPSWWDSLGVAGAAAAHADTSIVLRRRQKGPAAFVAPATAEHIKLTAAGVAVPTNYASTSDQNPAESGLDVYCEYDGTNVPIVIQTGVAYA